LRKATSELAARYETIVCEDLNVSGMTCNRRLARAVSDQGFAAARRMLSYKATWNGGKLIVADRWFPSSKTCSGCATVKTKLSLSERSYRCGNCGLILDRDTNAAQNLLHLAASGAERLNACGGYVRPGTAGRRPLNQEPGTARAETGPLPGNGRLLDEPVLTNPATATVSPEPAAPARHVRV
jgi:putative transposase